MNSVFAAFLLGFPALFSIVNPVSGAFIFRTRTGDRTHMDRVRLARRVGALSAVVMLVALWAGSYVLAFFGITLPALRCAGGTVVALYAWTSLNTPERREARKHEQIDAAAEREDIAFYPLTLPFTTGPGTISVAVALGSAHPASGLPQIPFFLGMTAAALCVSALVWLLYSATDHLDRMLGQGISRAVMRLSAFFQLCIGVQILLTGLIEALGPLVHP